MRTDLPKAILFDLDDTILALSGSADEPWRIICTRFSSRVEGLTPDQLFSAIREARSWFWQDRERHRRGRLDLVTARREIVAESFRHLKIDDPTLANEIADTYASEREETVRPFPGAIETLGTLQSEGIRLALITNGASDGQRRKIDRFGLEDYFQYILVEGEFGVGKPDERVYLHALRQLEAAPEDTWFVGDNLEWDVEAPQRLGIFAIWVDFVGKGLPEASHVRPDRIINNISEILKE